MNALAFQLNKVRRLINTNGTLFRFVKVGEDEFGEPNGQTESVMIKGLYHETTSYLSKSSTESTTIKQKSSPMILCLWDDVTKITDGYELQFNGKKYTIGGIKNLSESNIIADISLEEVQCG